MVYDVIGTAALMSGVNLSAGARPRSLDRRAYTAHKAEARAAREKPPGNAVHPLRTSVVSVKPSQAQARGGRRGNKKQLLKAMKNAPIDTFHSDDFFYSVLYAGPQAIAMLQDLMNTLFMEYQSMPQGDRHEDTFGCYIFGTLDFPITLADIIDSIQVLRLCEDAVTNTTPHAMASNLATIYNVSGHIASLLAMYAFYHTDLLRPGNFAPVYNVHLTTSYYTTLCRGLLLTIFDTTARELLTWILRSVSLHELWLYTTEDELKNLHTTQTLKIESVDESDIKKVLFNVNVVKFQRKGVLPPGSRIIANPQLAACVSSTSHGGVDIDVEINYQTLHEFGYFIITEGDAVQVHNNLYVVVADSNSNSLISIPIKIALMTDQTCRRWLMRTEVVDS